MSLVLDDDRTVLGIRQGRRFRIYTTLRGADTVETTAKIVECWKVEKPDAVIVDGDGIGAGVVDQLRYRGLATNPHQMGVDDLTIQAILRHGNVSVTQRCYIKTASSETKAAMEKVERA